ncbi:MAG: RsmD family RNA methyltransferase [Alphaproteobacteria bacterium]|nr:RsmD family RNA methyltransferase [Alphaproteobacteria bacterium]
MSLRITGGTARGRVLRGDLPSGVRPTGSRVREAVFSVLGQDLSGTTFLDAFAGSGLMGLEAWSRGAVVTCVERDPKTASRIRALAAELGADLAVRVGDVTRTADGGFDIVYADPPFALDPAPILAALASHADDVLLLEADQKVVVPRVAGGLALVRTRRFGNVSVHEYRKG